MCGAASHVAFGCAGVRHGMSQSPPISDALIHTLALVADCIYPDTSGAPGAVALGIEEYLIRQLGTKYYRRHTALLREMTHVLDMRAREAKAEAFADAPVEVRRRLVDRLAQGTLSTETFDSVLAFDTMVTVTLEGCFADPRYGGNYDRLAWDTMSSALDMRWFDDCDCH